MLEKDENNSLQDIVGSLQTDYENLLKTLNPKLKDGIKVLFDKWSQGDFAVGKPEDYEDDEAYLEAANKLQAHFLSQEYAYQLRHAIELLKLIKDPNAQCKLFAEEKYQAFTKKVRVYVENQTSILPLFIRYALYPGYKIASFFLCCLIHTEKTPQEKLEKELKIVQAQYNKLLKKLPPKLREDIEKCIEEWKTKSSEPPSIQNLTEALRTTIAIIEPDFPLEKNPKGTGYTVSMKNKYEKLNGKILGCLQQARSEAETIQYEERKFLEEKGLPPKLIGIKSKIEAWHQKYNPSLSKAYYYSDEAKQDLGHVVTLLHWLKEYENGKKITDSFIVKNVLVPKKDGTTIECKFSTLKKHQELTKIVRKYADELTHEKKASPFIVSVLSFMISPGYNLVKFLLSSCYIIEKRGEKPDGIEKKSGKNHWQFWNKQTDETSTENKSQQNENTHKLEN